MINKTYALINTYKGYVKEEALFQSPFINFIQDSRLSSQPTNPLPDIYYIILDGYSRHDILEDLYGYQNDDLIDFLDSSGFYLAEDSHTNYGITIFSLSSSLNSQYLDGVSPQIGYDSRNPVPLVKLVHKNSVVQFLKEYGYQFVSFSSGYSDTEIYHADIYLSPSLHKLNPIENAIINLTPLQILLQNKQYEDHRSRIQFTFSSLPKLSDEYEQPLFVFAHILAPHPPFVFHKDGTAKNPQAPYSLSDGSHLTAKLSREEYVEGYRDQLVYVNSEVKKVITEILGNSPSQPVIILQSDHGPGSQLDWESMENSYLPERLSILNAYYFPDQNYTELYSTITPVNTFRAVFDQYFGTNFGLLEDRTYYSTMSLPYTFIDVTDLLVMP